VLGRRADGYHELVTVMQPLSLADELTVTPAGPGLSLECNHPELTRGDANLVWRAARRFEEELGQDLSVHLTLRKHIPVAAGLGGGSSDAATTLLALNALTGELLDQSALHRLAGELGADVPFFLLRRPAVGRGIGTRLTPLTLPPYWYLLLNPGLPLSTRWVYENLNLERVRETPVLEAWDPEHPESWVHNDLAAVAVQRFPELAKIMLRLENLQARAQGVSGSGPTVFGLFPSLAAALEAGKEMRRTFRDWLTVAQGLTGDEPLAVGENRTWMI
jgi:4-diphosphocytidyl-2-C-methyl-D-erythritol kinase